MDDTQHESRVTTEDTVDQLVDGTRDERSSVGPVSRMLANPRRVRRS